jgi:hypothetical protein
MSGSGSTPATAHPAGDRQGQLAGAATKIYDDVVPGQPEGVHHHVDYGWWITAPVLVVKIGDFAAEIRVHACSVPRLWSVATVAQPTA